MLEQKNIFNFISISFLLPLQFLPISELFEKLSNIKITKMFDFYSQITKNDLILVWARDFMCEGDRVCPTARDTKVR